MLSATPAPRPPLGGVQARLRVLLTVLAIIVAVVGLAAPTASAGTATGTQNGVAAINPEIAPAVANRAAVSPGSVGISGPLFDDGAVVSLVTPSASGTAIRQVGRHLESVDDVLANPRLLAGRNPAEVQAVIGRTPGWQVETLGRGSHQGQGWVLREYTSAGNPTGRMLRWHPGGGHHGPDPYWRVTDFNTRSEIIR